MKSQVMAIGKCLSNAGISTMLFQTGDCSHDDVRNVASLT